MSGHTPGPWWPDASHYGIYIEANAVIGKRLLQEICAVGPTESGREQQIANALLIAAAPDLLVALLKLMGTPDDPNCGWRGTGGTDTLFACEFCHELHEDCTLIPHTETCPIPFARAALAKATGDTL